MSSATTPDGSEEMTPALKAIKLLMPTMLKHLRKADEATITKLSMTFAEGMYWVSTGKELPSDKHVASANNAERDSVTESATGPDNWSVGIGEVDSIGIPDSAIRVGLPESADSGNRHETEVQGSVDSGGDASGEAVQKVGSRRPSRKLNATAVEFGPVKESA